MGFLVQCETSHTSPLTLKIAVKWYTVTFTNTKTCYLHSTKLEKFSLSDGLQTNHCDCWRSWNYSIYERVVDSKQRLFFRYVRTRSDRTQSLHIHPARLRTGNLRTKLLFINFRMNCARSVNGQWNAELKRIFPEVFVFPLRWTRVTRALGTRLLADKKWCTAEMKITKLYASHFTSGPDARFTKKKQNKWRPPDRSEGIVKVSA